MARQTIRPYEMSVWGLQDDFITTLSSPNITHKGQVIEPLLTVKDDGTQELTFSIPMYYFENNKLVENPLWWDTKNGVLLVDLRKIKVIFAKGDKDAEKVYEFVITKITEEHSDNGELYCSVECEGLAFQELGKTGYKITLSQENFELEYEDWFENHPEEPEPIASLNYWADKIFENSNWTYEVRMDWSAYDGIINRGNEGETRRTDKVYEDDYVSAWNESNGALSPANVVSFREKARMVSIEKSNRYNATQDLAEAFEVFCRYEYEYDDNYHIIGRKCIFYNTFFQENKQKLDLQYAYNSDNISREMDASEITTKMYVVPLEDDTTDSGLLTIADASANKTGEDYILNFDYLYSIGGITQEQYDEIAPYELNMYILNNTLIPLAKDIADIQEEINEKEAELSILDISKKEAQERMDSAKKMLDAILGEDGTLERGAGKPDLVVYLKDSTGDFYHINISQEGVIASTLKLYNSYSNGVLGDEVELTDKNFSYEADTGVLTGLQNLATPSNGTARGYLTYSYCPSLQYQQVYNAFSIRLAQDSDREVVLQNEVASLKERLEKKQTLYEETLKKKEKAVADFENMMGAAIKEGSWQAESYTDYGNYYNATLTIGGAQEVSQDKLRFYWDTEPFDGEQLGYYEEGVEKNKVNYYCIDLTGVLDKIKDHIDDLNFFCNKPTGGQDYEDVLTVGSQMTYAFYKKEEKIIPVLMILDKTRSLDNLQKNPSKLGYTEATMKEVVDDNGTHTGVYYASVEKIYLTDVVEWFVPGDNDEFVYPRLCVNSSLVKTSYDDFKIKYEDEELQKYYDYSILYRDYLPYITLDNNFMMSKGKINKTITVNYILSNGALSLYLDALEVSKTNAFPKVSYEVSVVYLDKSLISKLYNCLGVIVNVNDFELKFDNVEGYISELELHLEEPWEDDITIKNYKTKFEDLFGRIVASSEEMKNNSYMYNTAAGAFTTSGALKSDSLQKSLSQANLTYSFMSGDLTIDEDNGIWGTSDKGVVAFRGGGIFTATETDSQGNWIWNTGITPEGISASLLRAGQIDTNNIRIFAGDNVRFQLNGEGLYAYRFNEVDGTPNDKEYVVHNGEGLFLTNKKGFVYTMNGKEGKLEQDINRVEISWDGLVLRNLANQTVFEADQNGNLSITGKISAQEGSIGGWLIKERGLVSADGTAGLYSTPLYDEEGNVSDKRVFWVGQDTNDKSKPSFYVENDGTFYANNAIIKGSISANSFIGGTSGSDVIDAIKKIEVANLSGGQTFNYYNDNLDGNFTVLPDILRFRIFTNSLTEEEMLQEGATEKEWKFFYQKDNNWIEIDLEADKDKFEFEKSYLTFTVKNTIMALGEEEGAGLIEAKDFKVVLKGRAQKLEDGYAIDGEYEPKDYEAIFSLRNRDYGINKFLSLIDPQSYTFIENLNAGISYASSASFSVILKNIDVSQGTWVIDGTEINAETAVSGSGDEGESTTKGGSTMVVPEIALTDGVWYIDDVEVKDGDTVSGNAEETSGSISITYETLSDGSVKSTITVPHTKVPEGGQIALRFQLNKASRTAFVFKTKTGADSVSVIVRSSTGTSFINGEGSANLTAELYFGAQKMNGDDATNTYYYVWKKDNVALSTINIEEKDEDTGSSTVKTLTRATSRATIFDYKTILITPDDFGKKADYSCYMFSTVDEAIDEYMRNNEEGLEEKEGNF